MDKQTDRLLAYLKENRKITALEALSELGIARLAARVYDLRAEGYDIVTRNVTVPTRAGKATIAEYKYVPDAQTHSAPGGTTGSTKQRVPAGVLILGSIVNRRKVR